MLPGNKSLLSLSLHIVPLLLIVVIIFEAAVFPSPVSLLRPVVVVTLPGSGPRPGPRAGSGAAVAGASDTETSQVFRLSETTFPFFAFPLSVSWLRKFGPKTVRGQASFAAVVAVAAAGTSTLSPKTRTPRILAAIGARAIRRWHF